MKWIFISVFCAVILFSCDQYRAFIQEEDYSKTVSKSFAYDLLDPDKKYFMGYSLEEISGLSYVSKHTLACVQDESGKLYLYDTKKKAVTRRIKFHKGGDYEGVEVVGTVGYVIKSNGDIYKVPLDDDDKPKVDKIETPFTSKNDIEGLGYDSKNGLLLIACKDKGGIQDKKVKGKAVYAFDPILEKTGEKVLFSITKEEIKKFVLEMKRDDKEISFQPSAIAMHPIEDRYYILASSGKALVVLSRDLKIEEYIKLKPSIFRQPEGICFSPDGDMYISNEGDGEDGYIVKFKFKQ